jgi:hypothetical protein
MLPAILLHALLMWQQAQVPRLASPVKVEAGDCLLVQGNGTAIVIPCGCGGDPSKGDTGIMPSAPPFDVPPVETKTPNIWVGWWNKENIGKHLHETGLDTSFSIVPLTQDSAQEYKLTCTDKSRFLLMSEDGRWHCLKLNDSPH